MCNTCIRYEERKKDMCNTCISYEERKKDMCNTCISYEERKKDMCNTCISYEERNISKLDFQKHQELKNKGLALKQLDKDSADTTFVITVDTEALLTSTNNDPMHYVFSYTIKPTYLYIL